MKKQIFIILFCSILPLTVVMAGVQYDPAQNCIWVTDFPAGYPCNMARIAAVAKVNEWGNILYDVESDTWTINANLWIGTDDGTSTYFQIGNRKHPRTTVIVRGNIIVRPPVASKYGKSPAINRLSLGRPDEKSISPTVKIDSEGNKKRNNLYVGKVGWNSAQLHVYNSTITASRQDAEHSIGSIQLRGGSTYLIDSVISWVKGPVSGPHGRFEQLIKNTVFENCGVALDGNSGFPSRKEIVGCTFRNCGSVLANSRFKIVLRDCVFENNQRNWTVFLEKLLLIDCAVSKPLIGDTYKNPPAKYPVYGKKSFVTIRNHVTFKVVDEDKKPIEGAEIVIKQKGSKDNPRLVKTEENDKTKILLTAKVLKSTDNPEKPEVEEFSYSIKINADGYAPKKINNFSPTTAEIKLEVRVKKKEQ